MAHKHIKVPLSKSIIPLLVLTSVLFIKMGFIQNNNWYFGLLITIPLLLIAISNVRKSKNAILRHPSKK